MNCKKGVFTLIIAIIAGFILSVVYSYGGNNASNAGTGYVDRYSKESEQQLLSKAKSGDAKAQCELAQLYQHGIWTGSSYDKNYEKAEYWFNESARDGYLAAQKHLSRCYRYGDEVCQKDVSKAISWLQVIEKNEKNISARAMEQWDLGTIYILGTEVPKDYSKAVYWYNKAVDLGSPLAQSSLGMLYFTGEGVTKPDYAKAEKLFKKSVENSPSAFGISMFSPSTAMLSMISYTNGDNKSSFKWALKSLENDPEYYKENPAIAGHLGYLYLNGIGTERNVKKGAYWMDLAARQGVAESQYALGQLYFDGVGVLRNLVEAYAWLNVSIASGIKEKNAFNLRDTAYRYLAPGQREAADALSQEYWRTYGKSV